MPLLEPTLLSLARAFGLAGLTLALIVLAGPTFVQDRRLSRALFWTAMFTLLAPGLPGYSLLADKAHGQSGLPTFPMYEFRVWCRYAALALLPILLLPPALSDAALHCFRTGARRPGWRRFLWRISAFGPGLWLGGALVFLFVFQEFEFATTWNVRSWTVALFDAQVGGMELFSTLRLALLPLTLQIIVLGALAWRFRPAGETTPSIGTARLHPVFLFAIAIAFIPFGILFCFLPALLHSGGLFTNAPWREMGNAAGLALAATVFAWPLSGWIAARRWRLIFLIPGLLGPLVCGLLLLAIARLPGLDGFRDSVFAPVGGLVLALLPYATLFRLGFQASSDAPSLHLARGTGARWPRWKMSGQPTLIGLLLLFHFGYVDFTINSLVAPPQFVSVGVRLLNLLHYGFSETLVRMYLFASLVPILAAGLTMLLAHLYARSRVR